MEEEHTSFPTYRTHLLPKMGHTSKRSLATIHTTPTTLANCILATFPTLLANNAHTAYYRYPVTSTSYIFSFHHTLTTSHSASGKPIIKPFTFHLYLYLFDDEITLETIPLTDLLRRTSPDYITSLPPHYHNYLQFYPLTGDDIIPPTPKSTPELCGDITLSPSSHATTSTSFYLQHPLPSEEGDTTVGGGLFKTLRGLRGTEKGTKKDTSGDTTSRGTTSFRTSKSSRSSGKQSEHIRESVVVLDHLLSCIPCLHEKFARYSEIDEVMRQAFRTSIPDAPPIAEHEMALITASLLTDAVEPSPQSSKLRNNCKLSPKQLLVVDAMDEIEGEKSAPWLRIPNTVRAPISYFQKALPDGSAIGKAHGVIDASAAAVLAMIMATDVPSYFKEHYEREGTEALMHVEFMPASHSMFYLVHKKLGLTNIGIPDRVFATWLTWWRCDSGPDEGCFFVAFCPIEEYNPRTVSLSEGCASTVNYYKEKEASLAKMKAFKKKLDAERLGVMQELGTGTAWHDIKKEGARKLKEFAGLEKARLAKFKPSEGGTSTSIPSVVQRLNATIAGNPAASKAIRGTTRGFWKIEPLAAEICRTTYVNQGNLGGSVPMAIMNSRIKTTLNTLLDMQAQFSRNGGTVDAELRAAFLAPPLLSTLSPAQRAIFDTCIALETSVEGSRIVKRSLSLGVALPNSLKGLQPLKSPSLFVSMFSKTTPPPAGLRSAVALGVARATIDCSATTALAYWSAVNSRERIQNSRENGDPAWLLVKEYTTHDHVVARIRHSPFPFSNREFVTRQLCATDANDELIFAGVPDSTNVDYGNSSSYRVQAKVFGLIRFTPITATQCSLAYYIYVDVAGWAPAFLINSGTHTNLSAVVRLRDKFQRDGAIDKEERAVGARVIRDEPQQYSAQESMLIDRVEDQLRTFDDAAFNDVETKDARLKTRVAYADDDNGLATVRAEIDVDASSETCAMWDLAKMSRDHTKRSASSAERSVVHDNEHSFVFTYQEDFHLLGFAPREYITRVVWKWRTATTLVVYYEAVQDEEAGRENRFIEMENMLDTDASNNLRVRGSHTALYTYERLPSLGDVGMTRVTWTVQNSLGGNVPRSVAKAGMIKLLSQLSRMRKLFDQSRLLDRLKMDENVDTIKKTRTNKKSLTLTSKVQYSVEEDDIIAEGTKHFAVFDAMKAKPINLGSPLTTATIAHNKKGSGDDAWGWATTTVRASREEVLAYIMDVTKRGSVESTDLVKAVDEQLNEHNQLVYTKTKQTVVANRETLLRCVWKETDGDFLCVTRDVKGARLPLHLRNQVAGKKTKVGKATLKERLVMAKESKARNASPAESLERKRLELLALQDVLVDAEENGEIFKDLEKRVAALRSDIADLESRDEDKGKRNTLLALQDELAVTSAGRKFTDLEKRISVLAKELDPTDAELEETAWLTERKGTTRTSKRHSRRIRASAIFRSLAGAEAVIRAKLPSALKITRVRDGVTRLTYVVNPDAGGLIPLWLMRSVVSSNLAFVSKVRESFEALRELAAWDAEDGEAVGEALVVRSRDVTVADHVKDMFETYRGLEELQQKHPFFPTMMMRVLEGKLRLQGDVSTKLNSVSSKQGEIIGSALSMSLATNLTAKAGVGEWVGRYEALREIDEEVWFRPMMDVVAQRLLGEVGWGVKARVFTGAALSFADLGSDVVMITSYLTQGGNQAIYGWILLGLVGLSTFIQFSLVVIQNKSRPLKMIGELLIALSGFKPALDASRVARGKGQDEHGVFNPEMEHTFSKAAELSCESIPGCVLQVYALLKVQDGWSKRAMASVLLSAMTTGYASAVLTFDFDVSPVRRKETPQFYGFMPDGGSRTIVFALMAVNSALLLLLRSFGSAMLLLANAKYLALYVAGDFGLYFAVKALRNDFWYWVPLDGVFGFLLSFTVRVIGKTICDYAGVIQFRHPSELGGMYWTVNVMLAMVMSAASVRIYYDNGETGLDKEFAYEVVGSLCTAYVVTFGLFLALIKPGYRRTFFTAETGRSIQWRKFASNDEAVKSRILEVKQALWVEHQEDVKTWVHENWWRWKVERPDWYTDAWIAGVPLDMIPSDENVRNMQTEIRNRRASLRVGVLGMMTGRVGIQPSSVGKKVAPVVS